MPRLFRVILPVSDIALAERFYSHLLGIPGNARIARPPLF